MKKTDLSNYLLSFSFEEVFTSLSSFLYKISTVDGYLQLPEGTRLYHSQKWFDIIFNEKKKAYRKILENKIIEENKHNWVCWKYSNDTTPNLSIENFSNVLTNLSFIKEQKFYRSYYGEMNSEVLKKLLLKYFGDNLIIPYEIEKRKILYTKAFDELQPYMRKYLNN